MIPKRDHFLESIDRLQVQKSSLPAGEPPISRLNPYRTRVLVTEFDPGEPPKTETGKSTGHDLCSICGVGLQKENRALGFGMRCKLHTEE